ncbi:MAG: TonB-dependent receptor [Bryobacteraceae bacterium]
MIDLAPARTPFPFLFLLILITSPMLSGGPPSAGDLSHASLEELMNIEVSSVSRKQQRLSETAAAVYVVTREDIRRSGASSIPELLRMAPGVGVARIDSSRYAITARGFNGRIANKMLVLIDGRTIYNNLYSGVFWEHFHIPLDDIERIEVIRGPGATVWGANAVNGVINIITAGAAETQGTLVTLGAGMDETAGIAVRYGGQAGKRLQYRVYGRHSTYNTQMDAMGREASDGWYTHRMGFRMDWQSSDRDTFSFQGDLARGVACQTVLPPLAPVRTKELTGFTAGFGLMRWTRKQSERSEMNLQIYFNRESRSEFVGKGHFQSLDFDFQHRYRLAARHELVWGGGYRSYSDDITRGRTTFAPASRTDGLSSSFVQDEIALIPEALTLTLGAKFQNNSYTGLETQPGARLAWHLSSDSSLWASVARAVRTPSRLDDDANIRLQIPTPFGPTSLLYRGNRNIRSETLLAWEGGYRRQLGNRATVDTTLFTNGYDRLRGAVLGTPGTETGPGGPQLVIPLYLDNIGRGRTWGVEVASNWNLAERWKVSANYSHLAGNISAPRAFDQLRPGDKPSLTSPAHMIQARSLLDITRKVAFDANAYYISKIPETAVPAYTRIDARVAWQINAVAEIAAGVTNLQAARHLEFVADDLSESSHIRRAAYVRLTWRF